MKKPHTIEAYGQKGMKNLPWRKTFTGADALNKWAEDHDATVLGTRDLEAPKNLYWFGVTDGKRLLTPEGLWSLSSADARRFDTIDEARDEAHRVGGQPFGPVAK